MQFITAGNIKITDLMPEDKYLELKKIMEETKFEGLSELKNKINDKFTYSEMRMVAKDIVLGDGDI